MRHLTLLAAALLASGAVQAQTAACLAPTGPQDGPVAIRDAKIVLYDTAMPGGGPQSRQTIVQLQACAAISGSAAVYALSYRPVLFSADGHLLQGGSLVSVLKVPADDAKGGPGHALINETFQVGYAIDRAKLPRSIMITALAAGTCVPAGTGCAPLPGDTAVRTVTVPLCVADGSVPPAAECPAAAK